MKALYKRLQQITGANYFPLLAGMLLIFVFLVGVYWREGARTALCGPAGEHCFREWVSATGGWVAIVFAYLTIKTMNRQTAETNRQQRENLELQILERLMRARRVVYQCQQGEKLCQLNRDHLDKAVQEGKGYQGIAPGGMAILLREMIKPNELAESNLTAPGYTFDAERFIVQIEKLDEPYRDAVKSKNEMAIASAILSVYSNLGAVQTCLETARRNAEAFIERWEGRVS